MNLLFSTVLDIAFDGIPSLFRRNLPKPVHSLRLVTWGIVLAVGVLFFLTSVPSLDAYRSLLKSTVFGGLVMLIAVLAAMTLMLKSRGKS